MKAVLLAAGVGKRLQPFTLTHPKCLVTIGGRSLLHRHLDILAGFDEVSEVHVVVGYLQMQLRAEVTRWHNEGGKRLDVAFITNEAFRRGSILSLYAAHEVLVAADTLVMDADVLYDATLMGRLVHSTHANCFLIDETARETGEEMMVCVRDGRALHIDRSRAASTQDPTWELKGEGVGFMRLSRDAAPRLVAHMESLVAAGQGDVEYEVALNLLMKETPCGFETVGDLAWTEIDFPADVVRAEQEVLPRLAPPRRATGS